MRTRAKARGSRFEHVDWNSYAYWKLKDRLISEGILRTRAKARESMFATEGWISQLYL